ncbi:MAG TPA: PilZ domain-containing protein [Methylomirabilota bacterium]|nr:PilZ domain-containing protein [Methylomirabilota bacterium]
MGELIEMDRLTDERKHRASEVRDRRFAIRFPFAADAEMLSLESGQKASGVTSDISMGGCFVCCSKALAVRGRVRLTLTLKGKKVEVLATIRVVKPRVGLGLEFLDLDANSCAILSGWIESLQRSRPVGSR